MKKIELDINIEYDVVFFNGNEEELEKELKELEVKMTELKLSILGSFIGKNYIEKFSRFLIEDVVLKQITKERKSLISEHVNILFDGYDEKGNKHQLSAEYPIYINTGKYKGIFW